MTQNIYAIGFVQDLFCSRRAIGAQNKSFNSFQKTESSLYTERRLLKTHTSVRGFQRGKASKICTELSKKWA